MKKYKNLEIKDRIFFITKGAKAVGITQNCPKSTFRARVRVCAAAAHSYSLNF